MEGISFSQTLDRMKESFLWAAAQGGNVEDCSSLLEIGADINWTNPDGDTPLLAACRRGHVDTVRLLIAHGANLNMAGQDSCAPIHISAKRGDLDCLDTLLSADASTTIRTKDGQTALDIAQSRGREEVYNRLMQQRTMTGSREPRNNSSFLEDIPITRRQLPTILSPSLTDLHFMSDYMTSIPAATPRISSQQAVAGVSTAPNQSSSEVSVRRERTVESLRRKEKDRTELQLRPTSPVPVINSSMSLRQDHQQPTASTSLVQVDDTSLALRKLVDIEQRERKLAETKLSQATDKLTVTSHELARAQQLIRDLHEGHDRIVQELQELRGDKSALDSFSMSRCEELEKTLRHSLDAVEARKTQLVKEELGKQKEQRLCVVCQEKEKSVVLLPCRHLCLCDACATHDLLQQCPLCRRPIAHKISVFD